ncbi:MAG: hypothetical protein MUF04_01645 [Akkermansiaceae bacterium]|jgi:hypothetical protein|nr:hypothetical protein [Akkermansiaceae bacterium]
MTKSKFPSALLAALVGLTTGPAALAQVSMRVDLVAWGPPIEGLTLKGPGGSPVTARPFSYGKSLPYNGPEILEIHQAAGSAPAAAPSGDELAKVPAALAERRKLAPTLVALAKLPTGSKRATVLLAPAVGGTYQAHVIDCDPSKVPVGKLSILNLSPYRIAMRFNQDKEAKQLAPKETHVVAPANGDVIYELAYESEGEWIMQENCVLMVPPEDQTQMIVLRTDSDLFRSSMGSSAGHLQLVTLRRGPREPDEIYEISKADREAAQREADRINREMEEQAKPENQRRKPAPR